MLAVKNYDQDYIDTCKALVDARLSAYDELISGAPAARREAVAAAEAHLCADLVLVLDRCFVHRTRAVEGKDGNALNEVRMLAESILQGGGVLEADKTIRYRPETSVLGLEVGAPIRLDLPGLRRLADAYFVQVQERFTDR